MRQKALSLMQFQKKFGTEKACQKHLFACVGQRGFAATAIILRPIFIAPDTYTIVRPAGYRTSLTAGTVFHKTRTPLTKSFWMIWLMGRRKSGICMMSLQHILEIKSYKTVWTMGHKIREASPHRETNFQLARSDRDRRHLLGAPKPGYRGRGAAGKAKVVVAVETPDR